MSTAEVSHRLQEIRVNLEKAVDLMERERPGGCDTVCRYINVSLPFVQELSVTSPC